MPNIKFVSSEWFRLEREALNYGYRIVREYHPEKDYYSLAVYHDHERIRGGIGTRWISDFLEELIAHAPEEYRLPPLLSAATIAMIKGCHDVRRYHRKEPLTVTLVITHTTLYPDEVETVLTPLSLIQVDESGNILKYPTLDELQEMLDGDVEVETYLQNNTL